MDFAKRLFLRKSSEDKDAIRTHRRIELERVLEEARETLTGAQEALSEVIGKRIEVEAELDQIINNQQWTDQQKIKRVRCLLGPPALGASLESLTKIISAEVFNKTLLYYKLERIRLVYYENYKDLDNFAGEKDIDESLVASPQQQNASSLSSPQSLPSSLGQSPTSLPQSQLQSPSQISQQSKTPSPFAKNRKTNKTHSRLNYDHNLLEKVVVDTLGIGKQHFGMELDDEGTLQMYFGKKHFSGQINLSVFTSCLEQIFQLKLRKMLYNAQPRLNELSLKLALLLDKPQNVPIKIDLESFKTRQSPERLSSENLNNMTGDQSDEEAENSNTTSSKSGTPKQKPLELKEKKKERIVEWILNSFLDHLMDANHGFPSLINVKPPSARGCAECTGQEEGKRTYYKEILRDELHSILIRYDSSPERFQETPLRTSGLRPCACDEASNSSNGRNSPHIKVLFEYQDTTNSDSSSHTTASTSNARQPVFESLNTSEDETDSYLTESASQTTTAASVSRGGVLEIVLGPNACSEELDRLDQYIDKAMHLDQLNNFRCLKDKVRSASETISEIVNKCIPVEIDFRELIASSMTLHNKNANTDSISPSGVGYEEVSRVLAWLNKSGMSFLLSQDGLGRALMFEDETYFPSFPSVSAINNNVNITNGLIPSVKPFGHKVNRIIITFEELSQHTSASSPSSSSATPSSPSQASSAPSSPRDSPRSPHSSSAANNNVTTAASTAPPTPKSNSKSKLKKSKISSPRARLMTKQKKSFFTNLRSSLLSQSSPLANFLQQMGSDSNATRDNKWTSSAISVELQPHTGDLVLTFDTCLLNDRELHKLWLLVDKALNLNAGLISHLHGSVVHNSLRNAEARVYGILAKRIPVQLDFHGILMDDRLPNEEVKTNVVDWLLKHALPSIVSSEKGGLNDLCENEQMKAQFVQKVKKIFVTYSLDDDKTVARIQRQSSPNTNAIRTNTSLSTPAVMEIKFGIKQLGRNQCKDTARQLAIALLVDETMVQQVLQQKQMVFDQQIYLKPIPQYSESSLPNTQSSYYGVIPSFEQSQQQPLQAVPSLSTATSTDSSSSCDEKRNLSYLAIEGTPQS